MARIIVLDSGPLGLLSNPSSADEPRRASAWAEELANAGSELRVPAIADYEVRRELLRASKARGVTRLDLLIRALGYLSLTDAALRTAAELWAEARNSGRPTARDQALDGDVILAAQALELESAGHQVVVATTNTRHLALYVAAQVWDEI